MQKKNVICLIAGLFLFFTTSLLNAYDPPNRVIRLSYASKHLSFSPAGETIWVQAVQNRPMYIGDRLWSGENSKAELQLDGATVFAGANTSVSIVNLNNRLAQFKLTQGRLHLYVHHLEPQQKYEIDTPNLAFTITQPGYYQIAVDNHRKSTVVGVVRGHANVYGITATYKIRAGKSYRFFGNNLKYSEAIHLSQDKFNKWCLSRVNRAKKSVSVHYVSPTIIGYEDLDNYGHWTHHKRYGWIWTPQAVATDWAPYRHGRWVWVDPWGWTWVDDNPWGFAPYHYGRWVNLSSSWYWVPGSVKTRAVYAPALVAFVGDKNFKVSVSVGTPPTAGVAWFPLGPEDVYVPSYRVSQDYFVNVNRSNTTVNKTQITNVYHNQTINNHITYQNQTVPTAVTAVSKEAFVNSQPVAQKKVTFSNEEALKAPVTQTAAVAPVQTSLVSSEQTKEQPPQQDGAQAVITRTAAPPAPVEFAKKLDLLAKDPGKPLSFDEMKNLRESEKSAAPQAPALAAPEEIIAHPKVPDTAAPEPVATPEVASHPKEPVPTVSPEPLAAPEVASHPKEPASTAAPKPVAAPEVISHPKEPAPAAVPEVISAPKEPVPAAAPEVISAPKEPVPAAAPEIISAPPEEPVPAHREKEPEPRQAPEPLPAPERESHHQRNREFEPMVASEPAPVIEPSQPNREQPPQPMATPDASAAPVQPAPQPERQQTPEPMRAPEVSPVPVPEPTRPHAPQEELKEQPDSLENTEKP